MRRLKISAAIRVEGPDALEFLQGQFSNDLSQMELGSCVYGLWLNQKGKILADSFVLRTSEESFLLLSRNGAAEVIFDRLDAYIIMDDVELEIVDSAHAGLSVLEGEVSEFELPEEGCFTEIDSVFAFWSNGGSAKRLEIVALDETCEAWKSRVERFGVVNAASHSEEQFQLDLWKAGVFEVGLDILESDLPQEVGLGERAVSYTKGCYLGQEVMARIHAMGRVRRRLLCVRLSGGGGFENGAPVTDATGAKKGNLRRTLEVAGEVYGSAILNIQATGELWLEDSSGNRCRLEIVKGEE